MGLANLSHFGCAFGALPDVADRYSGELWIVGGGRGVWSDLQNYRDQAVMCINDIGMHFPKKIAHWFSCHGDQLTTWSLARKFRYRFDSPLLHSTFTGKKQWDVDISGIVKWPWPGHASSGINAAYTGLALGYDEIVLAGVPYDDDGHYFDPPEGHSLWSSENFHPQFGKDGFRTIWENANKWVFEGKVKSMSGMTRDVLGGP